MSGATIDYLGAFVIVVSVITVGIIATTQNLSIAFNYSVDQASSVKAKDTLLNIVENPGAPVDWAEAGTMPTIFGLRWPSSLISTPSPFGLMRILEPSSIIDYNDVFYNDLSANGISIYLNKSICLDYKKLKGLVDPNGRYSFQINLRPVVQISTDYSNAPELRVGVQSLSGPINGANVTATVFTLDKINMMMIKLEDMKDTTISGKCAFNLSGVDPPFFVYLRASYHGMSSVSYYSSPNLNQPAIVPIVTSYTAHEVSLVHSWDVHSDYTYSGEINYASTFMIPLEENILHSSQTIKGDIIQGQPPPTQSLEDYKSTPGFSLIFYKRVVPGDFGLVVMPWGFNSLGLTATIGPGSSHMANVVTQNMVVDIGRTTYDVGIKLWRDIVSTETVSGPVNVTVTSTHPGSGFVLVDGVPITTPKKFTWVLGSTHKIQANSPVSGGPGVRYVYAGWSDGGDQTHSFVAGSATTVTAIYRTQYEVSFEVSPSDKGSIVPSATAWYNSGFQIPIQAIPNSGYALKHWSSSTASITFASQSTSTKATIGGTGKITANFDTAVDVTVTSTYPGEGYAVVDGEAITTPNKFTWALGSTHTIQANSPVSGGPGVRYVYTGWSDGGDQTHVYMVSSTATVTAIYVTQYKVLFKASGFDSSATGTLVTVDGTPISTLPFNKWVDKDTTVTYSFTNPVPGGTGKQFRLDSVTGPSSSFTVTSAVTVTGNYRTQYEVSFEANPSVGGSIVPSVTAWYDSGKLLIQAIPNSGYGLKYWSSSTASITFESQSASTKATIGGTGKITANFANTVDVTVASTQPGSDFVLVDGTFIETPQTFAWILGSTHKIQANSLVSGGPGLRYVYTGWSDGGDQTHDYTASSATTVTAIYKTQYNYRFEAPDLDDSVAPTTIVLTVGSIPLPKDQLPYSDWFDFGTMFPYSTTIASTTQGKRFVYTSQNIAAPSGGNDYWTVTGHHKIQYMLTIKTNGLTSPHKTKVYLDGVPNTDDYGISEINDNSVDGWRKWFDAQGSTGTIKVDDKLGNIKFIQWDDLVTNNPRSSVTMSQEYIFTAQYQK